MGTRDKEDLQIAYISAICASASISYDTQSHDDDSTDGIIKKKIQFEDGSYFNSSLRIQLKCTSSKSQYSDNGISITYKLKAKNFNDLCAKATTPIILGLLILPEDVDNCVQWSTEELLIKGCMYWKNLSGESATHNSESVNVSIDKTSIVNGDSLLEILEKIARGEWE